MCSRYYIDPDMMEEISRVVQNIDGRIRLTQGDIRPTDVAPVIGQSEHGLELGICRWGYPLSKGKNPVINARVETVMDKPSFQNGILYHRLLIPAGRFYEWNSSVLYMAGFCDWFENERRFVILTTTANSSMKKVHDRMPLILERGQITDWFDNNKMPVLLHQTPALLNRQTEYEQQSLFS